MIKVCHLVPHVDAEASGPSYTVPRLAQAIAIQGYDVSLASLDRGACIRNIPGVTHHVFTQSGFPKRLGRSTSMKRWLDDFTERGELSLIHSHGLWMMPNIYPAQVVRGKKVLHIAAPRGTLDPAALVYSRWTKKSGVALRPGARAARSDRFTCDK